MEETLLTRYRMLKSVDGGRTWTLEGHQDAHNGDSAVRKFFGVPEEGIRVVAVTERSWRPLGRKKRVVEQFVAAPVDDEPVDDEPVAAGEDENATTYAETVGAPV